MSAGVSLAIAGVCVGMLPASAALAASAVRKAGAAPAGAASAKCTMSLTRDSYDGFHIAVPKGWELSTLRGEVEVENGPAAQEAVLVSPGIQTHGLTAGVFFHSQLSQLQSQARSQGRPITITGHKSHNGIPSVTFKAPIDGQTVRGYATVASQKFRTQLSASQLAFVAYWAPVSKFASQSSRLSRVAACYGPQQASLYHVFKDQVFTYMMPPGWSVRDESQDAIDLVDHRGDYVTYEFVGGSAFHDPASLISVFLSGASIDSVKALWTQSTPTQTVSSGATQSSTYEEFTANFKGEAVHGLIYALTDVGTGFNTGVVRIVLAAAGKWNAINGALLQMVGSIQHSFTQDLQEIQRLNQQWQSFSNQVANFDDVLNNQQLTQDPTTGIYYYAPYDSYEQNGPNGPGYYNNDQRLNIITRPT